MKTKFPIVLCAAIVAACAGPMSGAAKAPDPLSGVPAQELFERGIQYKNAGDLIRAEQYLVSAVDRGYPEKDALEPLLEVCVAGSRYQAGLSHAQRHLARHPEDWALRYFTASLYIAVGDVHTARVELERVVGEQPALAEAHYALAILYRDELRDAGAAESAFRRYLELSPNGDKVLAANSWLAWHRRQTAQPMQAPTEPSAPVRVAAPNAPIKVPAHDSKTDL